MKLNLNDDNIAGLWTNFEGNPILGGERLGACFDVNVVRDGPAPWTMYFSWRSRKAIALVRSEDGFAWTQEPEICPDYDSDMATVLRTRAAKCQRLLTISTDKNEI